MGEASALTTAPTIVSPKNLRHNERECFPFCHILSLSEDFSYLIEYIISYLLVNLGFSCKQVDSRAWPGVPKTLRSFPPSVNDSMQSPSNCCKELRIIEIYLLKLCVVFNSLKEFDISRLFSNFTEFHSKCNYLIKLSGKKTLPR